MEKALRISAIVCSVLCVIAALVCPVAVVNADVEGVSASFGVTIPNLVSGVSFSQNGLNFVLSDFNSSYAMLALALCVAGLVLTQFKKLYVIGVIADVVFWVVVSFLLGANYSVFPAGSEEQIYSAAGSFSAFTLIIAALEIAVISLCAVLHFKVNAETEEDGAKN